MLNRRSMLAAGTALVAMPAIAAPAARTAKGRRGAPADPVPAGSPATTALGPIDTAARYAIVVDFNTGATLLDKEADVQMPPSSMTKLMTAYIVYGMLKIGRLQLSQELPVSEKAWRMQGSKMFVPMGGNVKVEDLIRGMIIQSGNDACLVLAEAVAGSEDQFVEQMNAKAAEL
ncbi:MAG: D-alanyl-D-alanine carboxypeptidase family protein, partial [Janthinobacterium lividum]